MKHCAAFALLLLAACSKEAEQTPAPVASDVSAPSASDAAPPVLPASPPPAARISRYTKFKDCTLIKANEEEDWSISHCKGLGGYDLEIDYADARDDLVLMQRGERPSKLGIFELGLGGFNTLADTAEWRGRENSGSFKPTALIVRNRVSEDPENSGKQTAILVVIDLQQGCVIAQVRPRAMQNEAARAIADGPRRACLR
jgi:hypothetical protein